jgi:superfamily II DNA or RNA helicase
MPTGSGKTAVMMAAGIALRSSRILVVAPSRLLREQLLEKFTVLDLLRDLGAVEATALARRVFEVTNKLATKKQWAALREYDVVVGTPMTLSPELHRWLLQPTKEAFAQ